MNYLNIKPTHKFIKKYHCYYGHMIKSNPKIDLATVLGKQTKNMGMLNGVQ